MHFPRPRSNTHSRDLWDRKHMSWRCINLGGWNMDKDEESHNATEIDYTEHPSIHMLRQTKSNRCINHKLARKDMFSCLMKTWLSNPRMVLTKKPTTSAQGRSSGFPPFASHCLDYISQQVMLEFCEVAPSKLLAWIAYQLLSLIDTSIFQIQRETTDLETHTLSQDHSLASDQTPSM